MKIQFNVLKTWIEHKINIYPLFERRPGSEVEEVPDEFDNYGDNIVHEVATNGIIVHNIEDDSDNTTFIEDNVDEAKKNEIIDIEESDAQYENEIQVDHLRRKRT